MISVIEEWIEAKEAKPIGKKMVSARIPLTTFYKIEVLMEDFDKNQTEILQAAIDIGLTSLIDEWRGMNSFGKSFISIDEEIEILKESGRFTEGEDNA